MAELEGASPTVAVTATTPAQVVAYPPHYWEHTGLNLYFNSNRDSSVDQAGAARYGMRANAPNEYVKELQTDLITIGYLPAGQDDGHYGGKTARAVGRFQRHARRVYRMVGSTPADVAPAETFAGASTKLCDHATATEVRKWIDQNWVIPVGRFKITDLSGGGRLREDAAAEWEALLTRVAGLGGTLAGPYGDTLRPLRKTSKVGASNYSFHYCGRAVDINQDLGNRNARQRYFVAQEPGSDGRMYWRIYCKTELQDGSQGSSKASGAVKCWDFGGQVEYDIAAGHYIDLTATIMGNSHFSRIKAHRNWEANYNRTEWWHFQYEVDIQETFQDELELMGFTEDDIRSRGWTTDEELDHSPG